MKPSGLSSLGEVFMTAIDTRIMLAAIIGWTIVTQWLSRKHQDEEHSDTEQELAPEQVNRLQKRISKLQEDNESLATEVVLLRSELAEVTTPSFPSLTPPQSALGKGARPSPPVLSSCRRLPLELLEDGTSRLRPVPATRIGTDALNDFADLSDEDDDEYGFGVSQSAPATCRTPPAGKISNKPMKLNLDLLNTIEKDNLRLAAENAAVRSKLEAIAPGSARESARARGAAGPAEENDRLKAENRELRQQLEKLVAENQDLAGRIMEVAFHQFAIDDEELTTASDGVPASPSLGEIMAATGSNIKETEFTSPLRTIKFLGDEANENESAMGANGKGHRLSVASPSAAYSDMKVWINTPNVQGEERPVFTGLEE